MNGAPAPENPYVFNGDFVDRGSWSVEVVMTLLAYKVLHPDAMHLTRGNHETMAMNRMYGFEGEARAPSLLAAFSPPTASLLAARRVCKSTQGPALSRTGRTAGVDAQVNAKHGRRMYDCFCLLFCHLPLAVTLNRKAPRPSTPAPPRASRGRDGRAGVCAQVFVCHGGLFREEGVTLADIDAADRAVEPPDTGVVCDILWSDPQDAPGRAASKRGTGCMFGPDVTQRFLADNGLELLVRSHEMKEVYPSPSSIPLPPIPLPPPTR